MSEWETERENVVVCICVIATKIPSVKMCANSQGSWSCIITSGPNHMGCSHKQPASSLGASLGSLCNLIFQQCGYHRPNEWTSPVCENGKLKTKEGGERVCVRELRIQKWWAAWEGGAMIHVTYAISASVYIELHLITRYIPFGIGYTYVPLVYQWGITQRENIIKLHFSAMKSIWHQWSPKRSSVAYITCI